MCIRDSSKDLLCADSVVYADVDNEAYYDAQLYGFAIGNETKNEYISLKDALQDEAFLQYIKEDNQMAVYDAKNFYHTCHKHHIPCGNIAFDIMIAAFLVDGTISDYDKLQEKYNFDRSIRKDDVYGKRGKPKLVDEVQQQNYALMQVDDLSDLIKPLKEQLQQMEMMDLFVNIEMPLTKVLYAMEKEGVYTSIETLDEIAAATAKKIDDLSRQIYDMAGNDW